MKKLLSLILALALVAGMVAEPVLGTGGPAKLPSVPAVAVKI